MDFGVFVRRMLNQLLARKKGLAVVATMSGLSMDGVGEGVDSAPGELTVLLQRKLGMSINKCACRIT